MNNEMIDRLNKIINGAEIGIYDPQGYCETSYFPVKFVKIKNIENNYHIKDNSIINNFKIIVTVYEESIDTWHDENIDSLYIKEE